LRHGLPGQFEFALGLLRGQLAGESAVLEGGEKGIQEFCVSLKLFSLNFNLSNLIRKPHLQKGRWPEGRIVL
jgi:hypothetical protein